MKVCEETFDEADQQLALAELDDDIQRAVDQDARDDDDRARWDSEHQYEPSWAF